MTNTVEPGLLRTSDGVLHVLYRREQPSIDTLAYTNISATGRTVATGTVVTGWSALTTDPKVVPAPGGGLRVVFGGIRTTDPSDPYGTGQMFQATAPAAGTTWTLADALTASHYAVDSYGTGATALADGTPMVSFPLSGILTWNSGAGDTTYDFGTCCLYDSTLARSGGDVWVSFAANGPTPATAGLFVKQLVPATGPTTKVPQSSQGTNTLTPLQSTAFVPRHGGGQYLAYCIGYPTCSRIGLWRVGTAHPTTVPGSREARDIAIAAAPHGRLWIAWTTYDRVKVVATSARGMSFGPVRSLRPPRAAPDLYGVSIAGTDRSADIVINNGQALYHQQVRISRRH